MSNGIYYDALAFRYSPKGNPFVIPLGKAKKRDDGSIAVYLEAVPAPIDGQHKFVIAPQRDRDYHGNGADDYREELE